MSASRITSSVPTRSSRPDDGVGKPTAARAAAATSGSRPACSAAVREGISRPVAAEEVLDAAERERAALLGLADLLRGCARAPAAARRAAPGPRPPGSRCRRSAGCSPSPTHDAERLGRGPRSARDLVLGQRIHAPNMMTAGNSGPRRLAGNAARCLGRGELVVTSGVDGTWQAARAAHSPAFCRGSVRTEVLPEAGPVKREGASGSGCWACAGAASSAVGGRVDLETLLAGSARRAGRRAGPRAARAISRVSATTASSIPEMRFARPPRRSARRRRAEPAVELVDAVLDRLEPLRHGADAAREPLEIRRRRQVQRAERDGLRLGRLLPRLEDAADRRRHEGVLQQLGGQPADRVLALTARCDRAARRRPCSSCRRSSVGPRLPAEAPVDVRSKAQVEG